MNPIGTRLRTSLLGLSGLALLIGAGVSATAGPRATTNDPGQSISPSPKPNSSDETQKPSNEAELSLSAGNNRYFATSVYGHLKVAPHTFFDLTAGYTHSAPESFSDSFKALLSGDATQNLKAHGGFLFDIEPNSIHGLGLTAGLSYDLNPLWHSERRTEVSVDTEFLRYSQSASARKGKLARQQLGATVTQFDYTFGLSQEILETLEATITYQKFSYNPNPAQLDSATGPRSIRFQTFAGVLSGLPLKIFTLGLKWEFLEDWEVSPGFSTAQVASTLEKSRTVSLSVRHELSEEWAITVEGSFTRDGNGSKSSIGGGSVGYRF